MALAVSPPRARAALLGLVLGASVVLTACNPGRPPAATVEGVDIPDRHVDALLDAYREADPELYEPQLAGQGEGTTQLAAVTQVLDRFVIEVAVAELAAERGVSIGPEDRQAAEDQLRTSLVQEPQVLEGQVDQASQDQARQETEELRAAVLGALPDDTRAWLIEQGAARIALSRELAEESGDQEALARAAYESDIASYTEYCFRVIQALETDLPEIESRLAAGDDFGQVSAELSVPGIVVNEEGDELTDVEGDIGCVRATQASAILQEAIAANPEGGVTDPEPVPGPDGQPTDPPEIFLLEVGAPQAVPFEEVAAEIVSALPDPGALALDTLLNEVLGDLDISVNPRFGRWDPESQSVLPPSGAQPAAPLPLADE